MTEYNKLIRGLVIDQMRAKGVAFSTRIIYDDNEYIRLLIDKLIEEVDEFSSSLSAEELAADVQEVIFALYDALGISLDTAEQIRQLKRKIRGGFEDRIFLEWAEDPDYLPKSALDPA